MQVVVIGWTICCIMMLFWVLCLVHFVRHRPWRRRKYDGNYDLHKKEWKELEKSDKK